MVYVLKINNLLLLSLLLSGVQSGNHLDSDEIRCRFGIDRDVANEAQ